MVFHRQLVLLDDISYRIWILDRSLSVSTTGIVSIYSYQFIKKSGFCLVSFFDFVFWSDYNPFYLSIDKGIFYHYLIKDILFSCSFFLINIVDFFHTGKSNWVFWKQDTHPNEFLNLDILNGSHYFITVTYISHYFE